MRTVRHLRRLARPLDDFGASEYNDRFTVFAYGMERTAKMNNVIGYVSGAKSTGNVNRVGTRGYWEGTATNTYLIINDALETIAADKITSLYTETQVKNGASFATSTYNTAVWDLTSYKMPVFKTSIKYFDYSAFANA